jgi:low affinity Fe/Cu permease
MNNWFRKFAHSVSVTVGSPIVFILACAVILGWALLGPAFGYSDTWQLVINTGTTIVTFLMVFLIQNTQNRDARAIHLKLDELIFANKHARNKLIDLETLSDADLEKLHTELCQMKDETQERIEHVAHVKRKKKGGA